MNKTQILSHDFQYGFHAGNKALESNWMELQPNKKGRWENGVGLNVTRDEMTLEKYYTGNRGLFLVVWSGTHIDDAGSIDVNSSEMRQISSLFPAKNRFHSDVVRYCEIRKTNSIKLSAIMNLAIANDMPARNTTKLAQIMTDLGADWSGDEKVSCIWNPNKMYLVRLERGFCYWDNDAIQNTIEQMKES